VSLAVSQLEVLITGSAAPLNAALAQGATAAKGFQSTMGGVAKTAKSALGTAVPLGAAAAGLAIAAFAKASFDSAIAFEESFTQIEALTNTSSEAIDGMKQNVLALAGETAQSPVELADAMYFLASAGLDTTQQMEALEAAAKGSAVGLGEAGDLARITANALNVFGDDGLKAIDVMDTLAAAVREGSAEPDEFADALGRVLPIADKAGISFAQVAASLATMSNAGLDVNEGVTALRGTLQSLVAPTVQTEDALAGIGLTVDDVVQSMQGQGLIATLRMLDKEARKNTESTGEYNILMRNLVPNVRALTGVFNLTGQEAAKVDQIFQNVADSAGSIDRAFAITSQSDAFKLKKAFNDLSIAGQELATQVLPAVATALTFIADHAEELFRILVGLAGVRIVQSLAGMSGAAAGVAAASGAAVGPTTAAAGAIQLEGQAALLAAERIVALTAANRLLAASAGASTATAAGGAALTTGQQLMAIQARNLAAAQTALAVNTVRSSAASELFNAGLLKNVPQVYALSTAVFGAGKELEAFNVRWQDVVSGNFDKVFDDFTFSARNFAVALDAIAPTTRIFGFDMPDLPDLFNPEDLEAANDAIADLLNSAGVTATEQAQVISSALASVGGSLTTDNIDDYVNAIKDGIEGLGEEAAAADKAARAAERLAAKHQEAVEGTRRWQESIAGLTAQLDQLSVIGIDSTSFLADFRKNLEEAEDPMVVFEAALMDIQSAAAEWRAATAESITGVGDVLSTLSQDAHLTATDVHKAFTQAAEDARAFTADIVSIGSSGGQAGKDLANALLQMGPSAAGLADVVAGSGDQMRSQLVHDFGAILAAGETGASKLQQVLVPVLKDIRTILTQLAEVWGITLRDNAPDSKKHVEDLHHSLQDLPPSTVLAIKTNVPEVNRELLGLKYQLSNITAGNYNVNVIVHTKGGSPMPDEVLKTHLTDPMNRMGFKKIGDRWTLPLDVAAHTAADALATPEGGNGGLPGLHRLIQVEVDNRGILKDIRQVLRRMDGLSAARHAGTGGVTGSLGGSGGSGGSTSAVSSSLDDALHRIVKLLDKSGLTSKESMDVVRRVSEEGADPAVIKKSVAMVADELGNSTAKLYARALKRLDDATLHSDAKRAALIKAALDAQNALKVQQKRDPDELPKWYESALKNVPRMPSGHTRTDPNIHHRDELRVFLDRPHFDRQMAYEESYRGY
jgi:TP901 family phage tail tape measure protein